MINIKISSVFFNIFFFGWNSLLTPFIFYQLFIHSYFLIIILLVILESLDIICDFIFYLIHIFNIMEKIRLVINALEFLLLRSIWKQRLFRYFFFKYLNWFIDFQRRILFRFRLRNLLIHKRFFFSYLFLIAISLFFVFLDAWFFHIINLDFSINNKRI